MNTRNKKNNPKNAAIAFAVVILISVISSAIENGSEGLGILIAVIFGAAAVLVAVKKAGETRKKEQSLSEKVYIASKPTAPVNCDFGDINCDFSHDYQRRVEQLDNFLKNGTIDRNEYNVLLKRYRENYEEHRE